MNGTTKTGATLVALGVGACSTSTPVPHPREFTPPMSMKGKHWDQYVDGRRDYRSFEVVNAQQVDIRYGKITYRFTVNGNRLEQKVDKISLSNQPQHMAWGPNGTVYASVLTGGGTICGNGTDVLIARTALEDVGDPGRWCRITSLERLK